MRYTKLVLIFFIANSAFSQEQIYSYNTGNNKQHNITVDKNDNFYTTDPPIWTDRRIRTEEGRTQIVHQAFERIITNLYNCYGDLFFLKLLVNSSIPRTWSYPGQIIHVLELTKDNNVFNIYKSDGSGFYNSPFKGIVINGLQCMVTGGFAKTYELNDYHLNQFFKEGCGYECTFNKIDYFESNNIFDQGSGLGYHFLMKSKMYLTVRYSNIERGNNIAAQMKYNHNINFEHRINRINYLSGGVGNQKESEANHIFNVDIEISPLIFLSGLDRSRLGEFYIETMEQWAKDPVEAVQFLILHELGHLEVLGTKDIIHLEPGDVYHSLNDDEESMNLFATNIMRCK